MPHFRHCPCAQLEEPGVWCYDADCATCGGRGWIEVAAGEAWDFRQIAGITMATGDTPCADERQAPGAN